MYINYSGHLHVLKYPNINRGTYVPATVCARDTRCRGNRARQSRRPRGKAAALRRAAKPRHVARQSRV